MSQPAAPNAAPATPPAKAKSPLVPWLAALGAGAGVWFLTGYLAEVFTHETTDDAFIAGHVISIAPRIAGQVAAVHILDNQLVNSNDLLVEIDPADYAGALAQKQTAADAQLASYQTMLAAWQLTQTKVKTAEDDARKTSADAEAAAATAERAQADLERATELREKKTISQAEFDAAQAAARQAAAAARSARENVLEAGSKVEEAHHMVDAAWAQALTVHAQWQEAQTNLAVAQLNLSYTKLFAPSAGRVTRKSVEPGDYVQAGQQLLNLVPTDVWVAANFKESQLKDMHPGQPVRVEIDALGGRAFAAHVDSIQAGSGAQFSLLPPENATGNFVKVIQRVPVKIVFDEALPADHVIGPGLSVTPSVQTSTVTLPGWAAWAAGLAAAVVTLLIFGWAAGRKARSA